jgi:hypothetical protein
MTTTKEKFVRRSITGNGTTHLQVRKCINRKVRRLEVSEFGITRFEADIKVMVKSSL